MRDYYYILGISKDSSSEEIKKAYRKLSLKFHPDRNDGDSFFSERFKEIQEAYETLSDTDQRSSYDRKAAGHFGKSNYSDNWQRIKEEELKRKEEELKRREEEFKRKETFSNRERKYRESVTNANSQNRDKYNPFLAGITNWLIRYSQNEDYSKQELTTAFLEGPMTFIMIWIAVGSLPFILGLIFIFGMLFSDNGATIDGINYSAAHQNILEGIAEVIIGCYLYVPAAFLFLYLVYSGISAVSGRRVVDKRGRTLHSPTDLSDTFKLFGKVLKFFRLLVGFLLRLMANYIVRVIE